MHELAPSSDEESEPPVDSASEPRENASHFWSISSHDEKESQTRYLQRRVLRPKLWRGARALAKRLYPWNYR